jgi:hypothetical protein
MPYSLCISAFWRARPLKNNLKNAAAAWMKQNPQKKITRYHLECFIGFAWKKPGSVGVDVSAFESTDIHSFAPCTHWALPKIFNGSYGKGSYRKATGLPKPNVIIYYKQKKIKNRK